jgi:inosose dehydratase
MKNHSRRTFFKTAGVALSSAALIESINGTRSAQAAQPNLALGMASYTFRKFSLEECIAMTKRLGLSRIALKSFHLPLDASSAEIADTLQKVNDAGLKLYGGGVIYMKNEEQVHRGFEYAKAAGMDIIIGVPNHELLDLVEQKVKEYDIVMAIHNHGPNDKVFPSPKSAYDKLQGRDARMGLCIDIGHTQRLGLDPVEEFIKYKDRVFDIHIKDVTTASEDGKTLEIGRGVIDMPKFIKTLVEQNYNGTASLEFEKDPADPLPGAAESIGYVRGILASI